MKKPSNISKCEEVKKLSCYLQVQDIHKFYTRNEDKLVFGTRKEGLKRLKNTKSLKYDDNRNELSLQTSLLSAYIKFGLLSIREVFWFFKDYKQYGLLTNYCGENFIIILRIIILDY